ncbi:endonuclease/exonuclease/phosphatase family protein [Lacibacter sediminis]|uniref:Endonuclease/exonuclease/phosphatase family protein n=1 Tax=Lacibacter sediminis TaxID=2760713 RepID=A0A7G5XH91_9BACT|nr:endonuclease/exonuclease/phosphatase family protein [Lacibacter sediminis]QNA44844.1 endonuclease/exonuclease/phosphatase family protein [Lacibacter sediminis]
MAGFFRSFTKKFFIFCNIALSVCMLLLYFLTVLPASVSWIVNLFALLFPFFLILQLVFLVFWLAAKRKLAFIPIITLLLCLELIGSFFGFHPKSKTTQVDASTFRVATWNAHLFNFFENKGHLDLGMLQEAKNFKADVLAVQELVFSLDTLSPITLEKVKKKLGYKYVAAANDRAFGVHTNIKQKNERYHPFCVAVFSNYPILRWEKEQSIKEYNHTFLWVDLLVNSDTIRLFNIHLQSMHFAKKDYEFVENIDQQGIDVDAVQTAGKSILRKMKTANLLRSSQARDVRAAIDKSPYPVIVCGDMNDVPNSNAYQIISDDLHDAFTEKGWGVGRTFKYLSPTLRIDYVLHSQSLSVERVQVLRSMQSDHSPVIADFNLQNK